MTARSRRSSPAAAASRDFLATARFFGCAEGIGHFDGRSENYQEYEFDNMPRIGERIVRDYGATTHYDRVKDVSHHVDVGAGAQTQIFVMRDPDQSHWPNRK
jgi:hypothetical protein